MLLPTITTAFILFFLIIALFGGLHCDSLANWRHVLGLIALYMVLTMSLRKQPPLLPAATAVQNELMLVALTLLCYGVLIMALHADLRFQLLLLPIFIAVYVLQHILLQKTKSDSSESVIASYRRAQMSLVAIAVLLIILGFMVHVGHLRLANGPEFSWATTLVGCSKTQQSIGDGFRGFFSSSLLATTAPVTALPQPEPTA